MGKKQIKLRKETAERLVRQIVERAKTINDIPEYLEWVDKFALFGSHLRGKKRPGDVDIFYKLERKEKDGKKWHKLADERRDLAVKNGHTFRGLLDEMAWPTNEVLMTLRSGSRGISLHNWWELEQMKCPHKIIYERTP